MTARRNHRQKLKVIAWAGAVALVVQALLPLLLAWEIGALAAEAPYLTATETIVCGPGFTRAEGGMPAPAGHRSHPFPLHAGCPICLVLAAGQAITPPDQVGLPLPTAPAGRLAPGIAAAGPRAAFHQSYDARAPPVAA